MSLQVLQEFVGFVDQDNGGNKGLFGQLETHNDDFLSVLNRKGRGSVHAYHARTAFPGDHVGFQSLSGCVADYEDLLSRPESRPFDQIPVDSDAAYVIDVGFGYGCLVNFRSQNPSHSCVQSDTKYTKYC